MQTHISIVEYAKKKERKNLKGGWREKEGKEGGKEEKRHMGEVRWEGREGKGRKEMLKNKIQPSEIKLVLLSYS